MTMCNVLRDAAKPVGIKKIGERSSLLWKLGQKTCEGKTCFDEELKGEFKNRVQEWQDLWEVWAASPADVLEDMRRRVALWKIPKLVCHTTYRKRLCGESERNTNGDQAGFRYSTPLECEQFSGVMSCDLPLLMTEDRCCHFL